MALTNPNTPISEQDLHNFYNRIKPYLGGGGGGGSLPAGGTTGQSLVKHSDLDNDAEWFDVNKEISFDDFNELTQEEKDNGTSYYIPDATVVSNLTVMGNRFDKANIYTDTERMIGSWIDGKPLYQKTLDFGSGGIQISNSSWTNTNAVLSDLDKIINAYGTHPTGPAFFPLMADYDFDTFNNLQFQACRYDRSVTVRYVTIRYTKTTDITVNIGTGNDYSTDEQIIGTWIDGKPIYQKVITGLSISMTWDDKYLTKATIQMDNHGMENIVNCLLIRTNKYVWQANVEIVNANSITFQSIGADTFDTIVLQYTKTTD